MNYNIQNAAGKMSLTPQTTLEEMFEQGAEWMKYEIKDVVASIADDINSGQCDLEEVFYRLKHIFD